MVNIQHFYDSMVQWSGSSNWLGFCQCLFNQWSVCSYTRAEQYSIRSLYAPQLKPKLPDILKLHWLQMNCNTSMQSCLWSLKLATNAVTKKNLQNLSQYIILEIVIQDNSVLPGVWIMTMCDSSEKWQGRASCQSLYITRNFNEPDGRVLQTSFLIPPTQQLTHDEGAITIPLHLQREKSSIDLLCRSPYDHQESQSSLPQLLVNSESVYFLYLHAKTHSYGSSSPTVSCDNHVSSLLMLLCSDKAGDVAWP